MAKATGKSDAKSSQLIPTQAVNKSSFVAQPFPEIQQGQNAAIDQAAIKQPQPNALIENINRSLASASPPPPPTAGINGIQAKLTIGAVGDKYEQEADRVAQQVVQRLQAPQPIAPKLERRLPQPQAVQRETLPEDDELQMKSVLQRETDPEEEDELQMKPVSVQRSQAVAMDASADLESAIAQSRGSGSPLADTIRQPMEQAFGADFSRVRIHADSQSDQLNRSIQARAFTTGQDLFFRQGAYQPGSQSGQELLAHELTHVVQQNGGTVRRSSHPEEITETPSVSVGDDVIQLMSFTRFSGLGRLNFFSPYTEKEKTLLDLEKRTGETLDKLKDYQANEQYGEAVSNLTMEFTGLKGGTYAESEYDATQIRLNTLFSDADSLWTTIAAQKSQDQNELKDLIAGSFDVVEPTATATQPNQVTQSTLLEITTILNDIYFAHESNLVIAPDMSYGTYDLAKRSTELSQPVPPEVIRLELQIRRMEEERELLQKEIDDEYETKSTLDQSIRTKRKAISTLAPEKDDVQITELNENIEQEQVKLESTKTKISKMKQAQEELDKKTAVPQKEYNILVKQMIKKETMKDLVKIAQTNVGRDLLKVIAKTSLESNAKKVTINAYSQYKNPTAAKSKGSGNPYVDYTPQYFKNRDTQERQEGGAILKSEALKKSNPWQENERTDITLFHELVHTYHFQSGASEKNNLVSDKDAVHEVDKPYTVEQDKRGVREEEYATVGLGKYSTDKYTENAYRAERISMGEKVSLRDMYTHKDEDGKRAT